MLNADFHSFRVFGAPPAADKAQLIVVLAGEYKIRKEIAYLVVPAVGRKVFLHWIMLLCGCFDALPLYFSEGDRYGR
jgi:hypothetical protein